MKKTWTFIVFAFALALSANLVFGDVLINEVMHHDNNSLNDEWIELYNNATENVSLINWIIADGNSNDTFSLNISSTNYGIIVDNSATYNNKTGCEAVYDLLNNTNFSCYNLSTIGSGLNEGPENVSLYNNSSSLTSNFSYFSIIKPLGKSFSYNGSSWLNCTPTPGLANNCTQTCSDTCSSLGYECGTQTVCNASVSCGSCGTGETCDDGQCIEDDDIYIKLEWDEDEIVNGDEFEITVKAYNLESGDYDVKAYITYDDEEITQIYDEVDEEWESWTEYASEVLSGPDDDTGKVKLKIKSTYSDVHGEATITANIRENPDGSSLDEFEDDIEVLEADEDDSGSSGSSGSGSSKTTSAKANSSSSVTGSVINLGGSKDSNKTAEGDDSIIYKSATEYIKEYAPYAFSIVCVGIIIFLLRNKL